MPVGLVLGLRRPVGCPVKASSRVNSPVDGATQTELPHAVTAPEPCGTTLSIGTAEPSELYSGLICATEMLFESGFMFD